MHIGKRIKDRMADQHISNKKMADWCGVSPGAISNWFSSGRISKPNLLKAAELLKIPAAELITGEEVPAPDIGDYSAEALALAWLLDQIPDRLKKTKAAHDATAAVLSALNALDAQPTYTPAARSDLKKQRA